MTERTGWQAFLWQHGCGPDSAGAWGAVQTHGPYWKSVTKCHERPEDGREGPAFKTSSAGRSVFWFCRRFEALIMARLFSFAFSTGVLVVNAGKFLRWEDSGGLAKKASCLGAKAVFHQGRYHVLPGQKKVPWRQGASGQGECMVCLRTMISSWLLSCPPVFGYGMGAACWLGSVVKHSQTYRKQQTA